MRGTWLGCAALALVSCAPGAEPEIPQQPGGPGDETRAPDADGEAADVAKAAEGGAAANVTHRIARTVDDVDSAPPEAGNYRVHLIDVGTGLAVLIQGADFNLLFDGGSADDKRGISATENNSRLLAYLWEALAHRGPRAVSRVGRRRTPDPTPSAAFTRWS